MKYRIVIAASLLAIMTGCQSTQQQAQQLTEIQQKLAKLENNQTIIARRVGLASLVRPERLTLGNGIREGSSAAKVAIIEFTDIQCPFCKRFNDETLPRIKKEMVDTNAVVYISQDYPLVKTHPAAGPAAIALRCMYEQSPQNYQQAKDLLFKNGGALSEEKLKEIATEINIDLDQFSSCRNGNQARDMVIASLKYGADLGIDSTPSFIIGKLENGELIDYQIIEGAKPFEQFKAAVEAASAK